MPLFKDSPNKAEHLKANISLAWSWYESQLRLRIPEFTKNIIVNSHFMTFHLA